MKKLELEKIAENEDFAIVIVKTQTHFGGEFGNYGQVGFSYDGISILSESLESPRWDRKERTLYLVNEKALHTRMPFAMSKYHWEKVSVAISAYNEHFKDKPKLITELCEIRVNDKTVVFTRFIAPPAEGIPVFAIDTNVWDGITEYVMDRVFEDIKIALPLGFLFPTRGDARKFLEAVRPGNGNEENA